MKFNLSWFLVWLVLGGFIAALVIAYPDTPHDFVKTASVMFTRLLPSIGMVAVFSIFVYAVTRKD